MAKIIRIEEHFQHFLNEVKESFWGDVYWQTRQAWKKFLELESERLRDRYTGWPQHGRGPRKPGGYRNGYYLRGFATVFGTIRLGIARARGKSFLPSGLEQFQRRAPELAMLIREAFLRGLSTRQVGRVVSTLSGEVVSAQTVSRLIRDLDDAVRQFHQAPLSDEWAYLFFDGVGTCQESCVWKNHAAASKRDWNMVLSWGKAAEIEPERVRSRQRCYSSPKTIKPSFNFKLSSN